MAEKSMLNRLLHVNKAHTNDSNENYVIPYLKFPLCQTKKSGRYQRGNQKPSNIHIYSYKSTWYRDIEDGQTIQQPKEKVQTLFYYTQQENADSIKLQINLVSDMLLGFIS
jgi:hypothetical protein